MGWVCMNIPVFLAAFVELCIVPPFCLLVVFPGLWCLCLCLSLWIKLIFCFITLSAGLHLGPLFELNSDKSIHFLNSLFNPGSWGHWSLSQLTLDERSGAQRTSRKPIIASCFQEFHMQSKQISQTINQCLFTGVFLWHHGLTVPQKQAACTTVISVVHKVMCIYNAWTKKKTTWGFQQLYRRTVGHKDHVVFSVNFIWWIFQIHFNIIFHKYMLLLGKNHGDER